MVMGSQDKHLFRSSAHIPLYGPSPDFIHFEDLNYSFQSTWLKSVQVGATLEFSSIIKVDFPYSCIV